MQTTKCLQFTQDGDLETNLPHNISPSHISFLRDRILCEVFQWEKIDHEFKEGVEGDFLPALRLLANDCLLVDTLEGYYLKRVGYQDGGVLGRNRIIFSSEK